MTPTTNNPKPSRKTHLNPNALDHLRPYRPFCTFHLGHLEWLGGSVRDADCSTSIESFCLYLFEVPVVALTSHLWKKKYVSWNKQQLKSKNVRKIVMSAFILLFLWSKHKPEAPIPSPHGPPDHVAGVIDDKHRLHLDCLNLGRLGCHPKQGFVVCYIYISLHFIIDIWFAKLSVES